jgi:hypothetical protein
VRHEPGGVLAEPMDVIVLAGRPVLLEPFIYNLLLQAGRWRPVESRAGAVADRSGAVHACRCRRCGPETVLRLQSPLIKPGVPFSSTRLSEVFHRVAIGAATYHLTVPS